MGTILKKYLYHWPLFLLGMVLASTAAIAYLTIVEPKYEISATILVKDGKKTSEEKSALKELDQTAAPNNAETEIQVLRSKNIVSKVVNDLQLWVSYHTGKRFRTKDLYGRQPFTLSLLTKGENLKGQEIAILIKDKNTFILQTPGAGKRTATFGETIASSVGEWKLSPSRYLDQFIGSTVFVRLNDPEKVSNAYINALDAHLLDKLAPTIGLFTTDEIPARGKNFLNRLISSYNGATSDEEKRTTKSTIDFIDNRLTSLKSELNDAEKEVEGFRTAEGLTDINSQSKVYLENVQTNDGKLNEVNVQLNVAEGIERYVNSASGTASPPATAGISDPALDEAIETLSQLQLKKAALLATTPESNPMFEPLNRQISTTRASIKGSVQGIRTSLLATKRELQSFNNKFESSIRDIPGQERRYVGMKRQQAIKENLYVYLLQKREELALSYASTLVDARIVDKANVGDIKWPKKQLVWAIAFVLGLGIPFLIIYFRRAFNSKIISRKEVELALNIPVLGEVDRQAPLVPGDSNPIVNEQFRTLRTQLLFSLESSGQVVLCTSSISGEGTSFICTNLAISLASTGKKVVLLDLNLHKPAMKELFNLSPDHPGAAEFLSSNLSLDKVLQPAGLIDGLDVIGSGTITAGSSELLENERLAILVNQLKERYSYVLIDSPPAHLVTDAIIIARMADVSLYTIRGAFTERAELDFISELFQAGQMPSIKLIYNGVSLSRVRQIRRKVAGYEAHRHMKLPGMSWKQFLTRF